MGVQKGSMKIDYVRIFIVNQFELNAHRYRSVQIMLRNRLHSNVSQIVEITCSLVSE